MSTTFGDLRSLLHAEPGDEVWQTLCRALDDYSDSEPLEELVLPYCLRVLMRWPQQVARQAPARWAQGLLAGQPPPPILALCTHLNLEDNNIDDEGARALATSPYLPEHIRKVWS